MKRVILILITCFLLTACAEVNENKLKDDIKELVSNFNVTDTSHTNNTLDYFSYYLPSDMTEESYEDNYVILNYENSKMIINLNIASIVSAKYYSTYITDDGFFNNDYLYFSFNGTFNDLFNRSKEYKISIYNKDDAYITYLVTTDLIFYGYSDKYDLYELIRHMIVISRSIDVDKDALISDYSSKDIINYQKEPINLFNVIIPVDGSLDDLVKITNTNDSNSN